MVRLHIMNMFSSMMTISLSLVINQKSMPTIMGSPWWDGHKVDFFKLNSAPIYWLSKKKILCETRNFGNEFVAMKQAMEYTCGLRYKLRMFVISVTEPEFFHGGNQLVLDNTTVPQSTLKKKSILIAFYFVREVCARDEWRTAYINTYLNVSNLMMTPLPGIKRWKFMQMLQHYICPPAAA